MKILHYVDENRLAWCETWIQLIRELNVQGTENHVICKSGGTLVKRLKEEGISFDTCNTPVAWLPWTAQKLDKIIDNFSPDIIHTRLSSAARIGGYWGKRKGIAVIQTIDKYPKAYYHRDADYLITCSESIKIHMAKQGFSEENMAVIHNPLDISRYKKNLAVRNLLRGELGIREEQSVIIAAGRFVKWKGFDVLLKAYARAASTTAGFSEKSLLLLLGDGEERKNLVKMMDSLNIKEKVIMPGFVQDIRPYLWGSDFFVLPSKTPEPFGIILIEAMASGLVPIATKGGGPLDIITDGLNGFFVKMDDHYVMSEKISMVISDSSQMKEVGKEAVKRAACFDVPEIAKQTMDIYQRVLQNRDLLKIFIVVMLIK